MTAWSFITYMWFYTLLQGYGVNAVDNREKLINGFRMESILAVCNFISGSEHNLINMVNVCWAAGESLLLGAIYRPTHDV